MADPREPFTNKNRTRYYGVRVGDICTLTGFGRMPDRTVEVIYLVGMDNNRVGVREGTEEFETCPEWLTVVTPNND